MDSLEGRIEERQLPEIQEAVRRMMKAHPHLHFLCTGPWPPYHFVEPIEPVGRRALAS